ncbi:hypothetical protein [Daejeonella sp.]|jgi:hypothetical protein|uniref:hypothetical protein n=1 Tax=Daejeonella sp. TaxID=2805397 RepID=UPI0037C0173A
MLKKNLLAFFIILTYFQGFGQNNIAIVNKIQGFYIFTDSQPISDYEVVGEVTTESHNDSEINRSKGQYQPIRDFLINAARRVNYTADGLVFSLVNGGNDKALIIKFKEKSANNSHSKVNQYQGVNVFVDSEPLNEYEYIGSVLDKGKSNIFQYSDLRDKLIVTCKKEIVNSKAIVLKLVYGGTDTGDVIKFKN